MKIITLLDRFYIYGKNLDIDYLSKALLQLLRERTLDLDVHFKFSGLKKPENRPIIIITGKDEEFAYNFLKNEYGTTYKFDEIKEGQILRGRMRNIDEVNFGIFLDCGIENPNKDVLLPIYKIRNQLVANLKIPKRKLCKAFGFFEEMPIYVKINKIDKKSKKIECEIANKSLNMIKQWLEDGLDILFSAGVVRKRIKKAIKRTGHYQDYVSIDRLGFLETACILRNGSNAPGILSEIGPLVKNAKFSMLRPKNIKNLINQFS
ncbi:MAG: DUF2110 family protein [Promethearchaeota archaeon]